jgi:hypothetical protein
MAAGDFVQVVGTAIHAGTDANPLVVTIASGHATTAGNTLIALWGAQQNVNPATIVNSSGTDSWSLNQVLGTNVGTEKCSLSSLVTTTGLAVGDTVTITPASSCAGKVAIIVEIQGACPFDSSGSASGATLAVAGTTMTITGGGVTAQAANAIIAATCLTGSVTQASEAATGYTNEGNVRSASGTIREVAVLYQTISVAAIPSAVTTWTGSSTASGVIAAFQIPAGNITVNPPVATMGWTGNTPAGETMTALPPVATMSWAGQVAGGIMQAVVGVATMVWSGLVATTSGSGGGGNDSGGPWYRPIIDKLEGWSPWRE